jgi:hypothetical protein
LLAAFKPRTRHKMICAMPDRLDRVRVQLASRPDPIDLPWDSRDKLLDEIRPLDAMHPIVTEFENAGASRPIKFTIEQKAQLRKAIEAWAEEVTISGLPAVVWDIRCALLDDLSDVRPP